MKTWKNLKTKISLWLVLILCLSMTARVSAVESGEPSAQAERGWHTITIEETNPNHTYRVYQIFTGVCSQSEDGKELLSDVRYGESYHPYGASVGTPVSQAALSAITDAAVFARYLINSGQLTTSYGAISWYNGYSMMVPSGYYLIVDSVDYPLEGIDDAYSAYMVEVVGKDVWMKPKSSTPTVNKQVWDNDDTFLGGNNEGWNKTADYAINESFLFKMEAYMEASAGYGAYPSYELTFHDTMGAGLTFEQIEMVHVLTGAAAAVTNAGVVTTYGGIWIPQESYYNPGYVLTGSAIVTGGGIVSGGSIVSGPGTSLILTIPNLRQFVPDLTQGVRVEVLYRAHLNEAAVITTGSGISGNRNQVALQYSNDPYGWGTGITPPDTAFVFTYGVDGTKYANRREPGNELAGAGFSLYRVISGAGIGITGGGISITGGGIGVSGSGIIVSGPAIRLYKGANGDYYVYNPVINWDQSPTTEMISSSNAAVYGQFRIHGLDVGAYLLQETTTPTGYNTCADQLLVLSATYTEWTPGVAEVTMSYDSTPVISVVNVSGTQLPSTGGMGTTLFYVVGSLLVVGAAILLVAKKRTSQIRD